MHARASWVLSLPCLPDPTMGSGMRIPVLGLRIPGLGSPDWVTL